MEVGNEEFVEALLSLDRIRANEIVDRMGPDSNPVHVIESLIGPALDRIGGDWERGKAALSQVYISGKICEELVDRLLPPGNPGRKNQPRMAIAVLDDYHMLGKRIVYSVIRSGGYELADFGRQDREGLVKKTLDSGVEVLLISTLMLPSALDVKNVRNSLDASGKKVTIVVGGAPFRFDRELWREVGADHAGMTAADALEIVGRIERSRT